MKLYVYELNMYKEDIEIKAIPITVRERKYDYFSYNYCFPVDEFATLGGYSITKTDVIHKKTFEHYSKGSLYCVSLLNNDEEIAKTLLIEKFVEVIKRERELLDRKEKLLKKLT